MAGRFEEVGTRMSKETGLLVSGKRSPAAKMGSLDLELPATKKLGSQAELEKKCLPGVKKV